MIDVPMIDVVVLDLDGGAMLQECLASLRAQTVPHRLILFDNGSKTPTPHATQRSAQNLGFAGGANAAFRLCSAPYVAIVNNDVVLEPDWLEHVRDALDRDEKLAAVQTIIRRPDGCIDGAGVDISDGTFRQIGYGSNVGEPLHVAWGVSATATLYRAAALGETVFDERLFAYYEDVELSARLKASGWRTAVLPVIKATHRGSATGHVLPHGKRLKTRNRYLVARWHPGVGRIRSLLWEDAKLLVKGQSSLRGIVEGMIRAMSDDR
ncbi:MAG TPA: glycosyltransferase family 2 protein [Thermoanaerobaculia bacterium]|nr:glycosyltransferase family 2 protein [Thermoanaerobaculia bacterium]